jgi:hypothetical protein
MLRVIAGRRALATAVIAIGALIGSAAGVSLAQGNDPAPALSTPAASSASPGGILADIHLVLAGLVADGTINPQQADAVQAQANSGSIDPKQLVDTGALTDTQMHAVAAKIDQVKLDNAG